MSTTHAALGVSLGDFERAWAEASVGGVSSDSVSAQSLSAQSLSAQSLSAQSLSAPSLSAPSLSGDAAGMVDSGVLDVAAAMATLQRAVDAPRVVIAGEIAYRSQLILGTEGMARKAGYAKPALFLAELWTITVGEGMRLCDVGLATRPRTALDGTPLPARCPVIASAIADGTLGVDSAAVIVRELDAASVRCSTSAREVGEATLVEMAGQYTVADLRGLARQVRDRLDEDGAEPRDELRHRKRSCRFITLPDGMVRMLWDMPPELAGLAKAAVDGYVSRDLRRAKDERRKTRGAQGDRAEGAGNPAEGDPRGGDQGGSGADNGCGGSLLDDDDDDRTLDQLRSDAAEQVFHHVASCKGHGGDIPSITMVIRMSVDALKTGLGIAEIDGIDETISASTARRMAGEAGIIPAVLGGPSEVLDFGKTRRLFTTAQKLAFGERDGGCAFGGCTAPPSYTEAHHIIWWSTIENTDLDNGILLCGFHHHRIHDGGWEIVFQHGVPYFIPPPWINPGRTPRRGGKVTLDAAA